MKWLKKKENPNEMAKKKKKKKKKKNSNEKCTKRADKVLKVLFASLPFKLVRRTGQWIKIHHLLPK